MPRSFGSKAWHPSKMELVTRISSLPTGRKLEAGGRQVEIIQNPSKEIVEQKLNDPELEGLIVIAHGGMGNPRLNDRGYHLYAKEMKRIRKGRKKLRFIVFESCNGWNTGEIRKEDTVDQWMEFTEEFVAYEGIDRISDRLRYLDGEDPDTDRLDPWYPPMIRVPGRKAPGPRPWVRGGDPN